MLQNLKQRFFEWITYEKPNVDVPLCDFERIRYELRPCDVLLIEGRSHVSDAIRQITQSPWSHACLYVGRLHDIDDTHLRTKLSEYFSGDPNVQFVIEGFLGQGTIVSPLENYKNDHIRICRPRGLSRNDAQHVIKFAIHKLGTDYDVRQIFDLARFMIPWSILPRRWRSSLFEFHTGESTRTVCSTMIAEAFASIDFPILPVVRRHEETGIELVARNPRIFTPRDFDYSPYFEIIKFPFISFDEGPYRNLPWNREGLISHDGENIHDPKSIKTKTITGLKLGLRSKNKEIAENPVRGEVNPIEEKQTDKIEPTLENPIKEQAEESSKQKQPEKKQEPEKEEEKGIDEFQKNMSDEHHQDFSLQAALTFPASEPTQTKEKEASSGFFSFLSHRFFIGKPL